MTDRRETALVVGAGPGLGTALARGFSRQGMAVAVARRNPAALDTLVHELGAGARAYGCDATLEDSVQQLFAAVTAELGSPQLVVYNCGGHSRMGLLETTVQEFERHWRSLCLGGFLVGREAARAMLDTEPAGRHRGTVLFTGATASLRGGARFHNLAAGKFGLRAVAQSMAREFQPHGIHVAHVIIDGQIESGRPGRSVAERGVDAVISPDAIAETCFQIHMQPASAWTLELDIRPYVEKF
jgi:NAD(P)-dependent dehydrogenase (short-subunit alcohol dehydrogenase family)